MFSFSFLRCFLLALLHALEKLGDLGGLRLYGQGLQVVVVQVVVVQVVVVQVVVVQVVVVLAPVHFRAVRGGRRPRRRPP